MSSELKEDDPKAHDDAAGPEADFVAPEDLIGTDLAAQLQEVLDEASAHLAATPPAGDATAPIDEPAAGEIVLPFASSGAEPEPRGGDAGTFESPAEVLAGESAAASEPSPSPAPVLEDEPVLDDPAALEPEPAGISFEEQLRELMALASGKPPAAPAPVEAPDTSLVASPHAAAVAPSPVTGAMSATAQAIDETAAKAEAMTAELEQLNSMIQAAVADADAPAEARVESVKQLDEILAGHADHAVADEFETVNDVIALEKALAELKTETTPAAAPRFAPVQQEVAPADPGIRYGDDTSLASSSGAAASAPAAPEPAAVAAAPAPALTTPATATGSPPASAATPPAPATRAGVLRDTLLRICITINRPLQRTSPATRNLIGYAGLITVFNGLFLVLLKLLRG